MNTFLIYFLLFIFWVENALGFSLTQIKGMSLFNLAIYLLLFAWAFKIAFQRKFFESNNVNKYLMLMILVALISIPLKIWRGDIPNMGILGELIYLKNWANPYILFFILINIIGDEKTCRHTLIGLIILLFIATGTTPLISIGVLEIGKTLTYESFEGRSSGFSDVNQFASYLVLFIPLVMTYFFFSKTLIAKMAGGILLLLSFVALFTTGSRGGVLSFVLSMAVYLLMLKRENILNIIAITLVVLALPIVGVSSYLLAPPTVKETVMERFNPDSSENFDQYTSGRTRIFRKALLIFMERPILGHGQNSTKLLYQKSFGTGHTTHNDYLGKMVHFGFVGLAIFIMIFARVFQYVWHSFKVTTDPWRKKLYLSYIAGFLGYTFSMLAVEVSDPRAIFWIYTAAIYKYAQLDEI